MATSVWWATTRLLTIRGRLGQARESPKPEGRKPKVLADGEQAEFRNPNLKQLDSFADSRRAEDSLALP
jgi:hypothetical protein